MKTIRARFKVHGVTNWEAGDQTVNLIPIEDLTPLEPDEARLLLASPCRDFSFVIGKSAALQMFKPGAEVQMEITIAAAAAPAPAARAQRAVPAQPIPVAESAPEPKANQITI